MLETEWDTPEGTVRVVDCMPVRDQSVDLVRVVEGVRGRVPMRMEFVVRFDYGSIVPWVHSIGGTIRIIAGPTRCASPRRCASRATTSATRAEFTVAAGDRVPFVLAGYPSYEEPPRPDRRRRGDRTHHRVLAGVDRAVAPTTATGPTWCSARSSR